MESDSAVTPNNCWYCGQRVLGIAGQEATLQSYMLLRDGSAESLADLGAIGPCHLICVERSGFAELWAQSLAEHFGNRAAISVAGCESGQMIFVDMDNRRVRFLDGVRFVSSTVDAVLGAAHVGDKYEIEALSTIAEPDDDIDLRLATLPTFASGGSIPLAIALATLRISTDVYDPDVVVSAGVQRGRERVGARSKGPGIPVVQVRHNLLVGDCLGRTALELISPKKKSRSGG